MIMNGRNEKKEFDALIDAIRDAPLFVYERKAFRAGLHGSAAGFIDMIKIAKQANLGEDKVVKAASQGLIHVAEKTPDSPLATREYLNLIKTTGITEQEFTSAVIAACDECVKLGEIMMAGNIADACLKSGIVTAFKYEDELVNIANHLRAEKNKFEKMGIVGL